MKDFIEAIKARSEEFKTYYNPSRTEASNAFADGVEYGFALMLAFMKAEERNRNEYSTD